MVWSGQGLADAVPPPPDDCPPGSVGTTGHGGPRCEKEAPKNCPNGWVGRIGGDCVLHQCSDDSHCGGAGKVCRQLSLCFEPRTRTSTCGSLPVPRSGELAVPGPRLLAEPCAELPEPVTDWIAVNVCGGNERCPAPSECRPGGLCVAPKAPPPAPMPRGSGGQVDSRPSGCGSGCAGSPAAGLSGGLVALGALSLWLLRRREGR